jgi:hypothetical protein
LYPNPSSNEIILEWKHEGKSAQVELMDLNGKSIYKGNWEGNSVFRINTSQLSEGMYMVHVKAKDGSVTTRKVLIKR